MCTCVCVLKHRRKCGMVQGEGLRKQYKLQQVLRLPEYHYLHTAERVHVEYNVSSVPGLPHLRALCVHFNLWGRNIK